MNVFVCFQAYATVVSAAEGNEPDSEDFGKVDQVKQYPSIMFPLVSYLLNV